MRIVAIFAAILAVTLAMPDLAAAQGRPGAGGAPVGHRQPSAKDMPSEAKAAPVEQTKDDRALEKALKGICRGC